jgi:uncharacterized damage-inducible protein DinB
MSEIKYGIEFLKELEAEAAASRKCIERTPENLFMWKPHEKSMEMGYLAMLGADIPRWITFIIEKGEIDFATWEKYKLTTTADLVKYFDKNMEEAKKALSNVSNDDLKGDFVLKAGGKELMRDNKKDSLGSTLNHWVHHRGQLTVYLRLNNIPVPAIYGPSADDKNWE